MTFHGRPAAVKRKHDMKAKTKHRILVTILTLGAAALILLPLASCNRAPEPKPTSTPAPTPAPSASPAAPDKPGIYLSAEGLETMLNEAEKHVLEEWKRNHPDPSPTPVPSMAPIEIPEFIPNPFWSDEERAQKEQEYASRAARKGIALTDEQGQRWGILSRIDNVEVTKGLPIESTILNSGENEPWLSRDADGWKVQWKKKGAPAAASPTPSATVTATPAAQPSPSPDV